MSREIDRQIAELMGYRLHPSIPEDYGMFDEKLTYIPQFSSDWNAMRLLVEWLRTKGLIVRISFIEGGSVVSMYHHGDGVSFADADTGPLALCKAVLKLPSEVLKDA